MRVLASRDELDDQLREWRSQGESWALVPTMGNLHAGHLRLVARARQLAARTLVTIFVNPTQFGPGEDFSSYPRTEEDDIKALTAAGADAVFVPAAGAIYPYGLEQAMTVSAGPLGGQLCGAHRQGHFDGVTTVVARLFALCRPRYAVFGRKDYQQLQILRRLNRDLGFGVSIHSVPTAREKDGLAMSSRNRYLAPAERARAPALYRALCGARDAILNGRDESEAKALALAQLAEDGIDPEYFELRAADLSVARRDAHDRVWLVAARIGGARLIDNVWFQCADS